MVENKEQSYQKFFEEKIRYHKDEELEEKYNIDFKALEKLMDRNNFHFGYDDIYFIIERFVDMEKLLGEWEISSITGMIRSKKRLGSIIDEFCEFLSILEQLLPKMRDCLKENNLVINNAK
jgi:hypothetical protein